MTPLLGARKEALLPVLDEQGVAVKEYRALFTTQSLAEAELRLGKSVGMALSGFMSGKSGVREIAILLQVGMEADRKATKTPGAPVSFEDACDAIDLLGIKPTAAVIGAAISAVLSYGVVDDAELDAEPGEAPEKN